jgi:hypothetical protein
MRDTRFPPPCSSPFCREVATKEWGIDKKPVCDACYAETAQFLAALLKETASMTEPKETEA